MPELVLIIVITVIPEHGSGFSLTLIYPFRRSCFFVLFELVDGGTWRLFFRAVLVTDSQLIGEQYRRPLRFHALRPPLAVGKANHLKMLVLVVRC